MIDTTSVNRGTEAQNVILAKERPDVFNCPDDPENKTETNYVAVTGQHTAWNENVGPNSDKAASGNTLPLLVEVADSKICWTEPRDIDIEGTAGGAGNVSDIRPGSRHYTWTLVVCADGRVWKLPKDLPASVLSRILKVHSGSNVDWRLLGASPVNLNDPILEQWLLPVALPVWLFFVAILLYRAWRSGSACPSEATEPIGT